MLFEAISFIIRANYVTSKAAAGFGIRIVCGVRELIVAGTVAIRLTS
jgi:hypothetical protein